MSTNTGFSRLCNKSENAHFVKKMSYFVLKDIGDQLNNVLCTCLQGTKTPYSEHNLAKHR